MRRFARIVRRDLQLALRHGMDSLMVVAFFVIAVVLFPLGVGPEPNMLARIAAGVVWVAALLSIYWSRLCRNSTKPRDSPRERMRNSRSSA